MPKEVLAAIVVGGILGLAIAFGAWRANQVLTPQNQVSQTKASPSPTPTTTELSLIITSPEDESVVNQNEITVEGKTIPSATVVITSQSGEIIVVSEQDGSWSGQIELDPGANIITVTAFSREGESVEKQMTLAFSTEVKAE